MIFSHPIELRTETWAGLSDKELLDLCQGNKHLKIERDENGNILIMAPTNFRIEYFNTNLLSLFVEWSKKTKKARITGSSGGFILPDSSMRAPDIALLLNEKYKSLTPLDKQGFPAVCPDFVVEIISSKEELKIAKKKMAMWMKNGCILSWLVDVFEQKIYVYEDGKTHIHDDFSKPMNGTQFLSDFTFLPSEVFSE